MDFAERLAKVEKRIASACDQGGRARSAVTLLAVSKGHPPETISEAYEAGLEIFGESKVQEAKAKIEHCSSHIRWQMIGHLQSNKCRDAVHCFEMVQSIDSVPLAEELNKWCDKSGKTMAVLLEVNVAGESSKYGFQPDLVRDSLMRINDLKRLEVQGLMTIAPWAADPERVRPFFKHLATLKAECEQELGAPLPHLSMGMSGDFEIAIEEGATLIRLGTILFGERSRKTNDAR